VEPPALRLSTAASSAATEVMSCVFAVADAAKLTMPMRLPEPIVPSVDLVGIDGFICECNAHACLLLVFDMVILCEKR